MWQDKSWILPLSVLYQIVVISPSPANTYLFSDPAQSLLSKTRVALVADILRCDRESEQTVRLRVTGESMLPTLWPGDEIEIASCALEDVALGEIVLAERDGRLFVHRLVRLGVDSFDLRGDSVPKNDPLFKGEALLGRLTYPKKFASGISLLWIRAVGILLCYCGPARRLVLRWHKRFGTQREFSGTGLEPLR
jgi:hypothetical protein